MTANHRPIKNKDKVRRCDKTSPADLRESAPARAQPPHAEAVAPSPSHDEPRAGDVAGTTVQTQLEAEAGQLTSVAPGTFLYGLLAGYFGSALDKYSYVVFMQKLVEQMAPADPLEAMLVEQIALSHHALGRAHVRAANANNPEAAKVFYSAAAKLQAEFRQSLTALKSYRGPTHPPGRAAAPEAAPLQADVRPGDRNGQHAPTIGDTELGSTTANRLKEFFDGLVTAGA